MTDYCSNHGSSSSSDIASIRRVGASLGNNSRIRVARLVRSQTPSRRIVLGQGTQFYGFAVRGGREFGTGFFISNVELGSQAELKGLRVGDQIIRVNGYHVDDAIHKELSQFISNQDRVTLKVRGVGMIPVKDRSADTLSWHIVSSKQPESSLDSQYPSSSSSSSSSCHTEICITLTVPPRTKLGLGICKGPDWKPGIYVQFTKENGVAEESGLRPGDQLVSCNGISFSDISFSNAVAAMKASFTLELIVRPGAGLDLFPGESSGYNSSASSVTEEHISGWINLSESKRNDKLDNYRTKVKSIAPPRVPTIDNNNKYNTQQSNQKPNTTIIQLTESGTVINNTLVPGMMMNHAHQEQDRTNCSVVRIDTTNNNGSLASSEIQTVKADVHRHGTGSIGKVPPPPPTQKMHEYYQQQQQLQRQQETMSISSSTSLESSGQTSSLSSAISEAVKLRAARNETESIDIDQHLAATKSKIIGASMADGNTEKHNALMDEFKKAHRKMFKNGFENSNSDDAQQERQKSINNGLKTAAAAQNHHGHNNYNNSQSTDEPDRIVQRNSIKDRIELVESSLISQTSFKRPAPLKPVLQKQKAPPAPVSAPTPALTSFLPPHAPTPTPDYDTTPSNTLPHNATMRNPATENSSQKGTMGRVAASEMQKANGAAAEMESIESYKMTNPSSPIPKPPPIYFAPLNSGPPTMKKTQRPVSVTIGEYGVFKNKQRVPTKFDFITKPSNFDTISNSSSGSGDDVSSQLRDELERTLSRSNLKKMHENGGTQNGDDAVNNNNGVHVYNNKSAKVQNENVPKKLNLQKTNSEGFEKLSSMLSQRQMQYDGEKTGGATTNRVTISIPATNGKEELRKSESVPTTMTPNGILKSSITNIKAVNGNSNGYATEQKNITFVTDN